MEALTPHAGPVPPPWGIRLGTFLARLMGWTPVGGRPTHPKAIFVACPHTTLWDGPIMVIVAWALGVRLSFITKKESFRFPFKTFVTFFGGIGVDRSKNQDMVAQVTDKFNQSEGLYIAVAPDGTRKPVDYWKSGFYHMAVQAKVPLVLGFLDYKTKRGGLLETYWPTGDVKVDMDHIRAAYEGVSGKYPQLHSRIRLKAEDQPEATAAR
jgi:1-acyl-sn-glycerol-3-phosphate acyltransferase